jgi:hypothetical protein
MSADVEPAPLALPPKGGFAADGDPSEKKRAATTTTATTPAWYFNDETRNLVRRAFATYQMPPHVVRQLGIQHVRGMLFVGSTLFANADVADSVRALYDDDPLAALIDVLRRMIPHQSRVEVVHGSALDTYLTRRTLETFITAADAPAGRCARPLSLLIVRDIDVAFPCAPQHRDASEGGPCRAAVADTDVRMERLFGNVVTDNSVYEVFVVGVTRNRALVDDAIVTPSRLAIVVTGDDDDVDDSGNC